MFNSEEWVDEMLIRDRVKELRRVRASELRPNPRNWRTHPTAQQDALRGMLAEIGYAGALLARETDDGELELIDGHLRAETTPDAIVPVLVLDVSAEEAAKLLATYDPLSQLAETNVEVLEDLLRDVATESEAVQAMLDDLIAASRAEDPIEDAAADPPASVADRPIPELFQIVVECDSEESQRALYERLVSENYKCRLLNL